jgi:hypothetical protein
VFHSGRMHPVNMVGTLLYGAPVSRICTLSALGAPLSFSCIKSGVDINIDCTPHRTRPNLARVKIARSLGREINGCESVRDVMDQFLHAAYAPPHILL